MESVRIVLIESVSSGSFAEETGCFTFRSEVMLVDSLRFMRITGSDQHRAGEPVDNSICVIE